MELWAPQPRKTPKAPCVSDQRGPRQRPDGARWGARSHSVTFAGLTLDIKIGAALLSHRVRPTTFYTSQIERIRSNFALRKKMSKAKTRRILGKQHNKGDAQNTWIQHGHYQKWSYCRYGIIRTCGNNANRCLINKFEHAGTSRLTNTNGNELTSQ